MTHLRRLTRAAAVATVIVTSWPKHEPWVDPGVIAWDAVDGDITSQVMSYGWVRVHRLGDYRVFYWVRDSSGNVGTATRIVRIQ